MQPSRGQHLGTAQPLIGPVFPAGRNVEGQLGVGTQTQLAETPTQVATDLVFVDITAGLHHTCGLLANGSYACWGKGPCTERKLRKLCNQLSCECIHSRLRPQPVDK